MKRIRYSELDHCELCEWRCGVNRNEGELGVCRIESPIVASCQLHPAPPQSYTIFVAGCNLRCLNCQNFSIAHYPDKFDILRGWVEPKKLAQEALERMDSPFGRLINADFIFFSGGAPTPSLPYIIDIINEARKLRPKVKVNYDTNGYMTEESLEKIAKLITTFTFDIKAFYSETFSALTGANVEPVLRNAETLITKWREKIWEIRILAIPEIIDREEIKDLAEFIGQFDTTVPICFLAFRPNFILDEHMGATIMYMEDLVEIAQDAGLENVSWAGSTGIAGNILKIPKKDPKLEKLQFEKAKIASYYAMSHGCKNIPRNCKKCEYTHKCEIKKYYPRRVT
ncbi:MAG: radical SAM protein [Candidatus Helarchaeota archaeon]|nr:radical SAM protein [Candidatus Helarchaeota archaeon]